MLVCLFACDPVFDFQELHVIVLAQELVHLYRQRFPL